MLLQQPAVDFRLHNRYRLLEPIGHGSYGVVVAAVDRETGNKVAIKKISNLFSNPRTIRGALREIKLMRHFNHKRILPLIDIQAPENLSSFNEIYIVTPLMETDLHLLIKSGQKLSEKHQKFFVFQLAEGLKHIHDCNVLHRDLKPGNVLLNGDCRLRICDFGMARVAPKKKPFSNDSFTMTVYRAPEVILCKQYTKAIDIWSLGCIFAEIILGQALFQGGHYMHQINRIVEIMGTPSEEDIRAIDHVAAQEYIRSLGQRNPIPWQQIFPQDTNPMAIDLMSGMLQFNPAKRLSLDQILSHPFLGNQTRSTFPASYIDEMDFVFENTELSADQYRELLLREIVHFHPEIAPNYQPPGFPREQYPYADSPGGGDSMDLS